MKNTFKLIPFFVMFFFADSCFEDSVDPDNDCRNENGVYCGMIFDQNLNELSSNQCYSEARCGEVTTTVSYT